ncbi:MAG TPA: type II secretion system F family protein [Patescibacteria group bacterium]|nr:type II secretion system F family protein [Patescibacteria group bacterium]
MKLAYKATTSDGKLSQGFIEAKDLQEAASFLRSRQLLPIHIQKVEENSSMPFANLFHKSTTNDLVLFTRQLSSMLTSGLTLMQALNILKEQMSNETMKNMVSGIISDVQEGKPLSGAIQRYPNMFTPIYISLIKAAENSGFLDKVLLRLADNLEKDQKLKGTVKSALMYPIVIVALMLIVMIVMVVFIIPQLTNLYTNLNIPLPFATQVVVTISNLLINFWPIAVGLVIFAFFLYRRWVATDSGKLIHDGFILKVPIFGNLNQKKILTEFARTFGLLIGSGTLVVQSLNESADISGNLVYKNAITDIAKRVEKGISVGEAMATYDIFPAILVQMVKIGEQTGKLDESLLKVSEYFEREVEGVVKTLTTAMEPFIMIILGVSVAFLIISIVTPIYNLTSSIQ